MSGNVKLITPSNGSVTLSTPDTASAVTVTIPAATDTVTLNVQAQTLTNKTLTAAGVNTVEATSGPTSTQLAGQRNKIINGAMMIDQRNAGASVTITANGTYVTDRWAAAMPSSGASKMSFQQSTTAPAGYKNSLLITSLSAYTVQSGDFFSAYQRIEGLNCADLGWGAAGASSVTLSFWVRSSVTGTYGGSLLNGGLGYSYPFSYTINAANTWEQKSIIISGPTSGTWATDSGTGIQIGFGLGIGSSFAGSASSWSANNYWGVTSQTNLLTTNGATFYITGVQLEKGATATPFENRLYGEELMLCQRYYEVMYEPFGAGRVNATPSPRFFARFTVAKRATPTCSGIGSFSCSDMYTNDTSQSANQGASIISHITTNGLVFGFNSSTLITSGPYTNGVVCYNLLNNGAYVAASAEL